MSARDLNEFRAEVDRLDDAMLDLLIERMAVVQRIGSVKGDRHRGGLALRPAREAAILRRLTTRAGESFPRAALLRMWRELLGATTNSQAPLSVSVWEPADRPGIRDLGRDHFGAMTPLHGAESACAALRGVENGTAQIALLPMPEERDQWWRGLLGGGERPLRVISRLPFLDRPGEARPRALAVAALEPEPSGDDLTLLVVETASEISRAGLLDLLQSAGYHPRPLVSLREPTEPSALHLIEVDGFVTPGDARLAAILAPMEGRIVRVTPIGGYPRPLSETVPG